MSGPPSLRAAGHALMYWQRRQEVNANNLANVETAGFRAERVFAEAVAGGIPALGTVVDPTPGGLSETGGPLDLALEGPGRFVVETPDGARLVRSGTFALDADGQVVNDQGYPLMGVGGALILPPGPVQIDNRGVVSVAGERIGALKVVREVEVDRSDSAMGGGTGGPQRASLRDDAFAAMESLEEIPETQVTVRQGYLEGSNVSALGSLIEMTTIQRSFEAVQNSVRAIDSMMDTVANRIGRVE